MFDKQSLTLLTEALETMDKGYTDLPDFSRGSIYLEQMRPVLLDIARRLQDEYPYEHPFYIGQMLKPPHPLARLAYALTMFVNPNNHALDGGKESSHMEKEAVAEIAAMFGWDAHLGHLTGGGTMANLEALWAAGEVMGRDRYIVASAQAHYTHSRITGILKLPFKSVHTDQHARMDMNALRDILDEGNVGTVVATLGSTATGSVDPLVDILELQKEYGFRVHVDSAYGGYFRLAQNLDEQARQAFDAITHADSIVVDPHKHGLQPYGCGCIVYRDPAVGQLYQHHSPYTYFSSDELHLGEISMECSRPGASAVALWATHQLLPPVEGGTFAADIERCRDGALRLYDYVCSDDRFVVPFEPELDILVWALKAGSISEASQKAQAYFDAAADKDIHLAVATLPVHLFEGKLEGMEVNQEKIACLRACVMKPEHIDWMPEILTRLKEIDV